MTKRFTARGLAGGGVAVAVLLAAGCGSSPAGGRDAAGPIVPDFPVPTSVTSVDGTTWAAVDMGGSAARFNNFWELFARPAGSTTWTLATPAGVASNGGIAAAPTGPKSVVVAFLPSQRLTFSPLSTTADGGSSWSPAAPVSPGGLAKPPDSLAAGPGGKLLALTSAGQVDSATSPAAAWTRVTTAKSLAASAAGRACGLTGLTAVDWTPSGVAMLAGACSKAGTAGIFTGSGTRWQAVGPALTGSLAHDPATVIGLATSGTQTTAVIAAGTGSSAGLVTAWSADGGSHWTLSPVLRTGSEPASSVAIWSDGSVGVVLSDGRGEVIGWQAAGWQSLPALPAHTSTLAEGPGTGLDALVARGGLLTVWQLPVGADAWAVSQREHVSIPYGTSG